MESRHTDERRCEIDKPRRFKIDKLEERIAPSADAACDALLGVLQHGTGTSQAQSTVAHIHARLC